MQKNPSLAQKQCSKQSTPVLPESAEQGKLLPYGGVHRSDIRTNEHTNIGSWKQKLCHFERQMFRHKREHSSNNEDCDKLEMLETGGKFDRSLHKTGVTDNVHNYAKSQTCREEEETSKAQNKELEKFEGERSNIPKRQKQNKPQMAKTRYKESTTGSRTAPTEWQHKDATTESHTAPLELHRNETLPESHVATTKLSQKEASTGSHIARTKWHHKEATTINHAAPAPESHDAPAKWRHREATTINHAAPAPECHDAPAKWHHKEALTGNHVAPIKPIWKQKARGTKAKNVPARAAQHKTLSSMLHVEFMEQMAFAGDGVLRVTAGNADYYPASGFAAELKGILSEHLVTPQIGDNMKEFLSTLGNRKKGVEPSGHMTGRQLYEAELEKLRLCSDDELNERLERMDTFSQKTQLSMNAFAEHQKKQQFVFNAEAAAFVDICVHTGLVSV